MQQSPLMRALMRALRALASLKLTLAALALLALSIVYTYLVEESGSLALVLSLLLAALNLVAAVATHPAFRRPSALLVFHLGLIALLLLAGVGRLTYLKGHVELSEGEEFGGVLSETQAGPWHWNRLDRVRFTNLGFRIGYAPGLQRNATRNTVGYVDADGSERRTEIGDQTPLVLHGYRFYTSPNKGFAPTFLWFPAAGQPQLGTVHLPSYPLNEYHQSRDWELPGTGIKLWTMLQFDELILDPEKPSEFRMPKQHKVIVRVGAERHELQPGQSIALPQGRLVYDGLRSWMGYTVFYDWTIHWMLAVCVIAVAALGWHYWRKFAARPWDA